jgi:hypothetical protein
MPKLILATATALLLGRSSARTAAEGHATVQSTMMHARTRSREATRRLRALGPTRSTLISAPWL